MPRKRPRVALVRKIKAIKAARAVNRAERGMEEKILVRMREKKPVVPIPTLYGVSHMTPVWRRVYVNKQGMLFISGINPIVDHPYMFYFRLFRLNPRSLKLDDFVSSIIHVRADGVSISAVSKDGVIPGPADRHRSELPPRGFRVAGPIIEEAEQLARTRKLRYLLLNTAGRKRIDYYKSFGFFTIRRLADSVDMAKDLES